jgi:hypothetical protein
VHAGLELSELLLLLGTEPLFLVDDHQAEVGETHLGGSEGLGADDNVYLAAGQSAQHGPGSRGARRASEPLHAHVEPGETLPEGFQVLSDKNGGGGDHRYLLAGQCGRGGGSERHLGFAEAHVTADQTLHRPAARQISQHGIDGSPLVYRFRIRKSAYEAVVSGARWNQPRGLLAGPRPGMLDERRRHLRYLRFHLLPARRPAVAGQSVES